MDEQQAMSNLEYIRSVMRDVRRRNIIDGVYYLIWGIVIPACTALTWWLGFTGREGTIGTVWLIGMIAGALCCFVTGWSRSRGEASESMRPESRLYNTVWILFGVTGLTTMIVSWGFAKLTLTESLFVLGLLLTMVHAVDASFSGMRWMYAIAAGWLIFGTLGLWLPFLPAALLFGFATIPLGLIPGIILTRIYRRERHGTS